MNKVRITSEPGSSHYLLIATSAFIGLAAAVGVYLTGRWQYLEAFNRVEAFTVEEEVT